jgi:hypothetical protein
MPTVLHLDQQLETKHGYVHLAYLHEGHRHPIVRLADGTVTTTPTRKQLQGLAEAQRVRVIGHLGHMPVRAWGYCAQGCYAGVVYTLLHETEAHAQAKAFQLISVQNNPHKPNLADVVVYQGHVTYLGAD